MIPDYEKNTVAFTERLRDEKKYGTVALDLERTFGSHPIRVETLSHCRDIWCRDFMPIQVAVGKFVQFIYAPSYLRPMKEHQTITVPGQAYPEWLRDMDPLAVPITLDGGSVVGNREFALVSERLMSDNPAWNDSDMSMALRETLRVKTVVWIPEHPDDFTGHVDGTVRVISDRTVVVANPQGEATEKLNQLKRYTEDVIARLEGAGFRVLSIPDVSHQNLDSLDVAGCFANFIQLENFIGIPRFNKYEGEGNIASAGLRGESYKVIGIECSKVAKDGGALNCITWNYRR